MGRAIHLLALFIVASGCREPTQVRVTVTRDFPCPTAEPDGLETGVTVGTIDAYRDKAPATNTTHCSAADPLIGTVIITPSGGRRDEIAFQVVAGYKVPVDLCVGEDNRDSWRNRKEEEGCIWSSRSLKFLPHDTVDVPVVLSLDCLNVVCDAQNSVCIQNRCVDNECPDGEEVCNLDSTSSGQGGAAGASTTAGTAGESSAAGGGSGGSAGLGQSGGTTPTGGSAGSGGSSGTPTGGAGLLTGGSGGIPIGGAAGTASGGTGGPVTGGAPSGATGGVSTGGSSGGVSGEAGTGGVATGGTSSGGTGGAVVGGSGGAIGGSGGALAPLGAEGPSCTTGAPLTCQGESCCRAPLVSGDAFSMGHATGTIDDYDAALVGTDEGPPMPATLAPFYLDTFEVTVGRFRRFVEAGSEPAVGDGAHPLAAGTGWQATYPSVAASLSGLTSCLSPTSTWTAEPSTNEDRPITCVSWYLALAFCAWDGGRLPAEVEWEYAAAGGELEHTFPDAADGRSDPTETAAAYDFLDLPWPVGTGTWRARWGHADMAGNAAEWTMDTYLASAYTVVPCEFEACFELAGTERTHRGGGVFSPPQDLRAANRSYANPATYLGAYGIRCARDR